MATKKRHQTEQMSFDFGGDSESNTKKAKAKKTRKTKEIAETPSEQPQEEIKRIKTPSMVDGTRDVLPNEERYWLHVENELRSAMHDYSYSRMETPILEKYELFNHTLFKQNG